MNKQIMSNKEIKWNEEELMQVVREIPVSILKDDSLMSKWIKEKGYSQMELVAIITVIGTAMPCFRLITFDEKRVAEQPTMTFGDVYDTYEKVRVVMIIIHRVNFLLHEAMITVYHLLTKMDRLRFAAKKYYKRAERCWYAYEEPRKKETEEVAWFTLQDHFSVMEDLVSGGRERVYEAIRDAMIRDGRKDIELKARVEMVFLMNKVCNYSYRAFFKDYYDHTGMDFQKCFTDADLSKMVDEFVIMIDSIGIGVDKDEHGFYCLREVIEDKGKRISAAWNHFMSLLQDEDLMDDAARKAIHLNPKVETEYSRVMEEERKKTMDLALDKLSEKYKVTKKK